MDSAFCSPPNPTPTCIPTMTSPGVPWERSRSSTWPVPDPDQVMTPYYRNESQSNVSPEFVEMGQKEFDRDPPTQAGDDTKQLNASPDVIGTQRPTPEPKKPRNPWGEMSYADLITKAILSSANKRLTLSEIYTWMIENVNYFREKANETSTSGWKNSIRHNLSLHDRFVKIPNEKTGKSNWWTVCPEASGKKSSRRPRSSSIDTPNQGTVKPKKEKKKVKKSVQKSLSVDTSATNPHGSPCASPTTQHVHQWSPMTSPAPGTPIDYGLASSPILSTRNRRLPNSSPLLSPVQVEGKPNLPYRNFNGSNNSLNETDQRDEAYSTQASTDSLYDSYPPNAFNSNNIHDQYGSSSSLSSLNSPLARLSMNGQIFSFPNPNVSMGSGCTSPVPPAPQVSSGIQSDIELSSPTAIPSPPPYEEAVLQMQGSTSSTPQLLHKHPLTLQHSFPQHPQHPLHISHAREYKRPRSTSMPIAIGAHERFPSDLDMNLFQNAIAFNIDVSKVLKTEVELGGGNLDFNMDVSGNSPLNGENGASSCDDDAFVDQKPHILSMGGIPPTNVHGSHVL